MLHYGIELEFFVKNNETKHFKISTIQPTVFYTLLCAVLCGLAAVQC